MNIKQALTNINNATFDINNAHFQNQEDFNQSHIIRHEKKQGKSSGIIKGNSENTLQTPLGQQNAPHN